MSERFLTIIIYDVSDNRRRYKLAKILKKYGYRVQRSAFETYLTNKKFNKLCREIDRFATGNELIRIYKLTDNSIVHIWGDVPLVENEDYFII